MSLRHRPCRRLRWNLTQLETRTTPAAIAWDGGGMDAQWTNILNWSNDMLPGPMDDVSISNASVDHGGGSTTIQSLTTSASNLSVNGGSIKVTSGLSMAGGDSLTTNNPGVSFTAGGKTEINGANLLANSGSKMTMNGLTSIENTFNTTSIIANDATMNLSTLTTIKGSLGSWLYLRANNGGILDISGVTTIDTGYVSLQSYASDSLLDASSLKTFSIPGNPYGDIYNRDGGLMKVNPSLTKLDRIQIDVDTATFPMDQLTAITNCTVFARSANFDFSNVTDVTGSNIYLLAAGKATFTSLTTIDNSANFGEHVMQADSGASLSFPNLTTLKVNESNWSRFRAFDGGTLSAPMLNKVDTGYLDLLASGAGSALDVGGLTSLEFPNSTYGQILARGGGTVGVAAGMTKLDRVYFEIDAGGFPTAQLTDFTRSTLIVHAGVPDVGNIVNFEGSWAHVYNPGTKVTLSGVTTIPAYPSNEVQFRADTGSQLEFPNVTSLSANLNQWTRIRAYSGAQVSFPSLTTVNTGYLELRAQGLGAIVSAPLLANLAFPGSSYGDFVGLDGELQLSPTITKLNRVQLSIDASGYPTANLTEFTASTLSAHGGAPDVSNITDISGSIVYSYNPGTKVTLSGVTTIPANTAYELNFQADSQSTIEFPNLVTVNCNSSTFTRFRAYGGGTVSLPAVAKINTGYLELLAYGSGSVLDASGLNNISFPLGTYGQITAQVGGTMLLGPSFSKLDRVVLYVDATGSFPNSQLVAFTNGSLYATNGANTFANLADFNGASAYSYYAGTILSLPAVTTLTVSNDADSYLQAYDQSTLDLPALTTITGSNQRWVRLQSYYNGKLNAPLLSSITGGYVQLLGLYGTIGEVNLPSLATLTVPDDSGGDIVSVGGTKIIVHPDLKTLNRTTLSLTNDVQFPVGQLVSFTKGTMNMTSCSPTFTNLTNFDGSGIYASSDDAVVRFPALTKINATPGFNTQIHASYKSTVDMPALTQLSINSSNSLNISANDRGKIYLPALTTLNSGNVYINCYNADDVIDMSSLSKLTLPSGNGGVVNLGTNTGATFKTDANFSIDNILVQFDNTAKLTFTNLDIGAGAQVQGSGTLAASAKNAGALTVGYPNALDTLEFTGSYVQTPTGTLNIQLGGTNQGVDYDWLKVGGAVALDGSVAITLVGGHQPVVPNSYVPVSGVSRTGTFVNYTGLDVGMNVELVPMYNPADLTLNAKASSGPLVVSMTPTGNVFTSVSFVDLAFNEFVDNTSFDVSDVSIAGPGGPYAALSVQHLGGVFWHINTPALVMQGKYTVSVGPYVEDLANNNMNQDGDFTNGEDPDDRFGGSFSIVSADLVVNTVTGVPANANFGSKLNLTWEVQNNGTADTNSKWVDRVYLSTDNKFDFGDIGLGDFLSPGLALGPGDNYTGNGTVTLPTMPFTADGNYFIIVQTDQTGIQTEADESNNTAAAGPAFLTNAPRVVSVITNGGAAQHSQVRSVTVTFSENVTFVGMPVDAFTLDRTGPGAPTGPVTLTVTNIDNMTAQTKVTLEFSGGLTTLGSLIDGRYDLVVLSDNVNDGSLDLDGNGDGTVGDDSTTEIFRLFGDFDGNRKVESADYVTFRATFNQNAFLDPPFNTMPNPAYNFAADFDNNGKIESSDYVAFRARFNTIV